MEKFLRPDRFDALPNATGSDKAWLHWRRTFTSFLDSVSADYESLNKLDVLVNHVSPAIYEFISESGNYKAAIDTLEKLYIAPKNEILARHLLATRRQQPGESLSEYLNALQLLAKDCAFKAVTATEYQEEMIRDASINGLHSQCIRQRLLENITLNLEAAYTQARSLEIAEKSSNTYSNSLPLNSVTTENEDGSFSAAAKPRRLCYFCGGARHNRQQCPTRDAICNDCGKIGHFAKVCQSKGKSSKTTSASLSAVYDTPPISTVAASPQRLQKAMIPINICGTKLDALIDTGSSDSFICKDKVRELNLEIIPTRSTVSMAQSSLKAGILGYVTIDLNIKEHDYQNQKLAILDKLCTDVII